jgi:hypothetical protein
VFSLKNSQASEKFVSVYLSFLAIAIFVQQFLPGYLGYSTIVANSFQTNDGWCEPQSEGIGVHCFGDFYYPLTFIGRENPWEGVINPYPPTSLILYQPFDWLAGITMPRIALSVFLISLIISLVFPILHLRFVSKEITNKNFAFLLLVTLTCAPALMSIDRGNIQLFLIPPLYMFLRGCLLSNEKQVMVYGLICVFIKPQFVVLAFVIYSLVGLKKTIKWMLINVLIYILTFLIYLRSFPNNILDWINQTLSFQDYAGRGVLMPVNVSISSDIDIILNVLNLEVSQMTVKYFVYLLLIGFTILLVRNLKRRSLIHNFTLVLFYPLLFTGTVFHYYLTILYVPFLFYVSFLSQSDHAGSLKVFKRLESDFPSLSKPFQSKAFLLFALLTFIPWGIPWSAIFPSLAGRGWDLIGINWVFSQYALLAFGLTLILQRVKIDSYK